MIETVTNIVTGAVIQAVPEASWAYRNSGRRSGRFYDRNSDEGLTGNSPMMEVVLGLTRALTDFVTETGTVRAVVGALTSPMTEALLGSVTGS